MRTLPDFKSINGDTTVVNIDKPDEHQKDEKSIYHKIIDWANSGLGEMILAIFFFCYLC